MVIRRGEIWWASLPDPAGSMPGYRRPVVVVQSNDFNSSGIRTVLAAIVTSNRRFASAPGNVELPTKGTGLDKVSVVNVSQLVAVDKRFLTEKIGRVTSTQMEEIEAGLRLVLAL
jgi:mRNA interferase MazF